MTAIQQITEDQEIVTESKLAHQTAVKILIVDDQDDIRHLYSKVIQKCGHYNAGSLCDGEEVVGEFEKNPHAADIIIMDQRMPRMDGVVASRKIKEINPKVKIIMVTSYDDVKKEDRELFESYLLKPVSINDLKGAIERSALQ